MARSLIVALAAAWLAWACPVPAATPGVTKPSLELRLLRPGVWIHTSYYTFPDGSIVPANGMVVRDGGGLLLVDTAWGEQLTVDLLDRIQREIKLPVRRAIVTHAHGDRLAGADVLRRRGVPVYALPQTISRAMAVGLAIPSDSLSGLRKAGDAEWLGAVEVLFPGPGHAPDNLMVWVPSARVLFGGCAVKSAASTSLGNLADADTKAWPEAIRRAMERYPTAEFIIPGHGAEGGKSLLTHTLELLGAPQ